jgi:hypothetical protein
MTNTMNPVVHFEMLAEGGKGNVVSMVQPVPRMDMRPKSE